jgi:stage II sporulation protein D
MYGQSAVVKPKHRRAGSRRGGDAHATLVMLAAAVIAPLCYTGFAHASTLLNAATGGHSTAMREGELLVINGAGDGHGVGMSQEGACGYAAHGYPYAAILAHYYSGSSVGRAPEGVKVRVLVNGKVQRIPLERYVRGVVSAEVPATWPMAALEAQAVASRTFALTAHAGGSSFDVHADARSQVYLGKPAETPRTNAAVADTAEQIVTYAGRPAITYFFASSGGMTEDVQNGFPGSAPQPWLHGVQDPYDQGPLHRWSITLTLAAAASRLQGLVRGSLLGIEVLKRGYSPRILSAYVLGSQGPTEVSGPELAARLGLYATWAYFSVVGSQGEEAEPDLSNYTPPLPAGQDGGSPAAPLSSAAPGSATPACAGPS